MSTPVYDHTLHVVESNWTVGTYHTVTFTSYWNKCLIYSRSRERKLKLLNFIMIGRPSLFSSRLRYGNARSRLALKKYFMLLNKVFQPEPVLALCFPCEMSPLSGPGSAQRPWHRIFASRKVP